MVEIFNDGVLRATVLESGWVVVEWLTNKVGYLSKTAVKDLKYVESLIHYKHLPGWVLASEIENTAMHKVIEKLGGVYQKHAEGTKIFYKEVK